MSEEDFIAALAVLLESAPPGSPLAEHVRGIERAGNALVCKMADGGKLYLTALQVPEKGGAKWAMG